MTFALGMRRARGTGLLEEKTAFLLSPKAACDLIKRETHTIVINSGLLHVKRAHVPYGYITERSGLYPDQ